jgi:hypothetical protein
LGVCVPSARWIARAVDRRKYNFTGLWCSCRRADYGPTRYSACRLDWASEYPCSCLCSQRCWVQRSAKELDVWRA